MIHAAPFYYRLTGSDCSIDGSMIALRLRCCVFPALVLTMIGAPAHAASVLENVGIKQRYEKCLSLANLNPTEALRSATEWSRAKGGAPAEHCLAMVLTELKRYPEAAARLDALGRAPDMGNLRATVFDQAGNAWMLAGEAARGDGEFFCGAGAVGE